MEKREVTIAYDATQETALNIVIKILDNLGIDYKIYDEDAVRIEYWWDTDDEQPE